MPGMARLARRMGMRRLHFLCREGIPMPGIRVAGQPHGDAATTFSL
jgi:hypothetical protein